jgi:HAMP domain-containing protein
MIRNEAQLHQALEQIENLCRAVRRMRTDVLPKNSRNFELLAEGPLDEIRKLQGEVDRYVDSLEEARPEVTIARPINSNQG